MGFSGEWVAAVIVGFVDIQLSGAAAWVGND